MKMPSTPRRAVLQVLGLTCGTALAGGSRLGELAGGETADDPRADRFPAGPKDPPTVPAELDADSARTYARQYERAVVYNTLSDRRVDTVSCDATVSAVERGYYVLASCRAHANSGDAHADNDRIPAAHYVSEDHTYRIPSGAVEAVDRSPVDAYRATSETGNVAATGTDVSVRMYNFGVEARTVGVWADFLGGPGRQRVFERQYRLAAGTGLAVPNLAVRRGRYRVTVALDTGPSDTRYWTLSDADSLHQIPVYLTPNGTVVSGEWLR